MIIRASLATASMLGLKNLRMDAKMTTLYFLIDGICRGNCLYCHQKNGYLARIKWPQYEFKEVKKRIGLAKAKRICIQSLYGYEDILLHFVKELKEFNIPISVSINAVDEKKMKHLKENGVERVGIGLDCFSPEIFEKWKKGVPSWNEYMNALKNAKKIFGKATCHLIAGLGESDEDAIKLMKKIAEMGIKIALFPYSKESKTVISLPRYRVLQIASYIIENRSGKILLDNGKIVEVEVSSFSKKAFLTSGCPDCNRPFYNEGVRKIYNYPYEINEEQMKKALEEANNYARVYITSEC
ncbi:hypothetical protein B6U81_05830 [Thermoplasmatales archaeon ex4484_30]|nr:MAG: radical SAM protein [Thermoplasmata archaeon]OYT59610.1 MAG: hypothetical protein B6U81_05830 [Thermoplasmatales archaeon ex4484_30]